MKKILTLLLFTVSFAFSQIPNQFNYQGVARDLNGAPLANKLIKIRLSILANGISIYSETFERTTNPFGLFVLPVGGGTVVSGNFASISWIDLNQKSLKTEIDPDGNGYSIVGDAPLLSVPYALSAKTVESENQKLSLTGSLLSISQGNSVDIGGLAGSQWVNNPQGINYNAGRVGIGTNNPSTKLNISGNFTGTERNPIELLNTSTEQDAICGVGLAINTTDRGGLQLFGETYFPTTLPFWNGRLILGALNKNGILVDAGSNTSSNIEFAVGPKNGQQTPVRMIVISSGNVGVGTVAPSQKLDVNGKVRIQDLAVNNTLNRVVVADAQGVLNYRDASTFGSGTSQWVNNPTGINYSSGNVGIGATNPDVTLFVQKTATAGDRILGAFYNPSDANTSLAILRVAAGTGSNSNYVNITAAAKSYFPNLIGTNSGSVSSERLSLVSGPIDAGAVGYINFITGSNYTTDPNGGKERMRIEHNGNIGIGTTTPLQNINDDATANYPATWRGVHIKQNSLTDVAVLVVEGKNSRIQLTTNGAVANKRNFTINATTQTTDQSSTLAFIQTNDKLQCIDAVAPFQIHSNGNVMIGRTNCSLLEVPKEQLHVRGGNVYIDDATKGMIMKSPNGQCWKVTVSDTGTLTSASVTCP